jgi:hypothetical protein
MKNEIKLLKNNDKRKRNWDDLQWIEEFYNFLSGVMPKEITLVRGHKPKMSRKKAFAIIWYLQEHFPLLPDHIEKCDNCDNIYDSGSGEIYWETKGKYYCGGCDYLVPQNYDRGKR